MHPKDSHVPRKGIYKSEINYSIRVMCLGITDLCSLIVSLITILIGGKNQHVSILYFPERTFLFAKGYFM